MCSSYSTACRLTFALSIHNRSVSLTLCHELIILEKYKTTDANDTKDYIWLDDKYGVAILL